MAGRGQAVRLRPEHKETLQELARSVCRGSEAADYLAARGLAVTGSGRFGTWARITEAGREYLARTR